MLTAAKKGLIRCFYQRSKNNNTKVGGLFISTK